MAETAHVLLVVKALSQVSAKRADDPEAALDRGLPEALIYRRAIVPRGLM